MRIAEWRRLSFTQHQHRAMGQPHDALGRGADQQPRKARPAVRRDDDQLGLLLFREVGDAEKAMIK